MNKIVIQNFRNIKNFSFSWKRKIILFSGPNGSGKTSILEAFFFLINGKSFKKTETYSFINNEETTAFVHYQDEIKNQNYSLWLEKNGKNEIYINDSKNTWKKMQSFFQIFILQSKDFVLIAHSKTERKKFFDQMFSSISSEYKTQLQTHKQTKSLINNLLKNTNLIVTNTKILNTYNEELFFLEKELNEKRKKYLKKINYFLKDILGEESFFDFSLKYENKNENKNFNNYDYEFIVEEKNLFLFYSEGISKVAVIFVQLAFINYYHSLNQNKVVYLFLDDVFAHLDNEKITIILSTLEKQNLNVWITSQEKYYSKNIEILKIA